MAKDKYTATSDAVYTQLRQEISHLELPPGSAISEIETAERFDVSRTPVRDAFKRLEREGLLEIRPHIGTFISLIDLNAVSDVLYMREALEYAVLSDLARKYDKSMDLRIRLLLQEQKDLIDSDMPIEKLSRKFIDCDDEFHAALFEAAGKKNITNFLTLVNAQYSRFRTVVNFKGKDDLLKLYEAHEKMWEYITKKDLDSLKDCINHHINDGFSASSDIIRKYPDYFEKLH